MKDTIVNLIGDLKTMEEVKAIEKILAPAKPTLEAVRSQKENSSFASTTSNVPSTKNIELQRRLYSTTKSSKKASVNSIRRPTVQESQNTIIYLILNKKLESEEISENCV